LRTEPDHFNDAILYYLAFGNKSYPQRDSARLAKEFGKEEAAELEAQVLSLLNELNSFSVDWSEHTLGSAETLLRSHLHDLHPNLSDTALRAVGGELPLIGAKVMESEVEAEHGACARGGRVSDNGSRNLAFHFV